MIMEVTNINGKVDDTCRCGSWLEHWRKFTWDKRPFCSVVGCRERQTVGVLVQKVYPADGFWYVVPVCPEHSRAHGTLIIGENYPIVSADVSQTCGQEPWSADSNKRT